MIKKMILLGMVCIIFIGCIFSDSGFAQINEPSYLEEARVLYDLGLYKGTSQYYFEADLPSFSDKETTLVFLLRLAGQRDNVQAGNEHETTLTLSRYVDGYSVSDWAQKYVAYGLQQNLLPDTSNYQISPRRLVDGKTFTAILLRTMGYALNGEQWKISTYINCYLGGISADEAKEYADKILSKNDMIAIVWKSLTIPTTTGKPFINSIAEKNNLQSDRLTKLGFVYSGNTITPPVFKKNVINLDKLQNNGYSMQDGTTFFGENLGGVPNGIGVVHYADGSKYEGNVVNGIRQGEGKLTRNDGFVYSGNWDKDKMTGYGTLKWPNGDSYTGELYSGYFEGYGTMVWVSGDSYTGGWIEGMFHGQGRFSWANGNYYDGNWTLGEFDGYGVFNILNVGIYEGMWQKGKKHGRGKYVFSDNTVQEGIWENDVFIGP